MTDAEQDELYFLSALGEEFCQVLNPVVGYDIDPHDSYEVFAEVLGTDFRSQSLASLTDQQIEQLLSSAAKWLETEGVTEGRLREVVRRTLARWPSGA